MASRSVSEQINQTLELLEEELDAKLNILQRGATPSVGPSILVKPSHRSTPTDGGPIHQQPPRQSRVRFSTDTSESNVSNVASSVMGVGSGNPEDVCKKPVVVPDDYDGKSSLDDWLTHFDICSNINAWTETQ